MEKQSQEKGLRYNSGKLRYDLVHPIALEGMVKVLTAGANKYAPRNWEKGMEWSTVLASLKRHIAAFEKGEDVDPESGLRHVDHMQCNTHFLSAYMDIAPDYDDRPLPKYLKVGLDLDGVVADFVTHFFKYLGLEGRPPTHWNDPRIVRNFDKVRNDQLFWSTMPPLIQPDEIEFEPHCYITARPVDSKVTEDWLDQHGFPVAKVYSIGHDVSKVDVAKESGIDVYVDDRYDNFIDITNSGIFCYLFDTTYNRHYNVGHRRIKSLKEVKAWA